MLASVTKDGAQERVGGKDVDGYSQAKALQMERWQHEGLWQVRQPTDGSGRWRLSTSKYGQRRGSKGKRGQSDDGPWAPQGTGGFT